MQTPLRRFVALRPLRGAMVGAALLLSACGFTSVHSGGSDFQALRGNTAITAPESVDGFRLMSRLEDRLGPSAAGQYHLSVTVTTNDSASAYSSDGRISRSELVGEAQWRLTERGSDRLIREGRARSFAGYDTGLSNTVAVRAAQIDAHDRLMVILADSILTQLLAVDLEP